MEWIKNFGKMIKGERLSWGMSRGRLQRLSHVDRETIADIENGKILSIRYICLFLLKRN